MELTTELLRKHKDRLIEAKVTVKGHVRRSKKGTAFNVKTYERNVKNMSNRQLQTLANSSDKSYAKAAKDELKRRGTQGKTTYASILRTKKEMGSNIRQISTSNLKKLMKQADAIADPDGARSAGNLALKIDIELERRKNEMPPMWKDKTPAQRKLIP